MPGREARRSGQGREAVSDSERSLDATEHFGTIPDGMPPASLVVGPLLARTSGVGEIAREADQRRVACPWLASSERPGRRMMRSAVESRRREVALLCNTHDANRLSACPAEMAWMVERVPACPVFNASRRSYASSPRACWV